MADEIRLLIVEDVAVDAELALRELRRNGLACNALRVETEDQYVRALEEFAPQLVLCDFTLPRFDGMSALALARERHPELPLIFVSGTIGEEVAVESLKQGATDYVLKSNLVRLAPAVRRALQQAEDRRKGRAAEAELASIRDRTNSIFDSLRDVVWSVLPARNEIVYINQATRELFGRPPEEFLTRPELWFECVHPDDRGAVREAWTRLRDGEPIDIMYRIIHRDGSVKWIQNRARCQHSAPGYEARIDGIATDITERVRQERKILRLSRMERVLSGVNSAIVRIRDRDELLREACRIAVEDGGFALAWVGSIEGRTHEIRPQAWVGKDNGFLGSMRAGGFLHTSGLPEDGRTAFRDGAPIVMNDIAAGEASVHRDEALRRGFASFAILPLIVEGEPSGTLNLYSRESDVFDEDELKLLLDLAGDVSFALAAVARQERLNYLAYYDALTGLPNRQLFQQRVDQLLMSASPASGVVALLMLDLQRFGLINTTLGRHAGDAVLKEVAHRLRRTVDERYPVGRLGADAFGIALARDDVELDIAHAFERTIAPAVSEPLSISGHELRLAARCGIAVFPNDARHAEDLFRNAEAALRNAKASGEQYLFYAPQINARVAEKLHLENRLRVALAVDEFVVHYQPKVDVLSRRITGLEALLRWRSPERGMVAPEGFIGLLEETGLILEVGRWVLRQAVQDYRTWQAAGLDPPRIAVNLSPLNLREAGVLTEVKRLAEQQDGSPLGLDLEITESLIMQDVERSIVRLQTIQAAGIGIAIDDFGTGYSSLSYIARLPVNCVKIDRSFIAGMVGGPHNLTIVSTIISLAHGLNLKVVAEGVETEEQLQLLRHLRCDEMQGFLFSGPLPADEIRHLIGSRASGH
jgi:diguanylate cyclase (GGDEF)-like protein/PAS domain S-box-containing protein